MCRLFDAAFSLRDTTGASKNGGYPTVETRAPAVHNLPIVPHAKNKTSIITAYPRLAMPTPPESGVFLAFACGPSLLLLLPPRSTLFGWCRLSAPAPADPGNTGAELERARSPPASPGTPASNSSPSLPAARHGPCCRPEQPALPTRGRPPPPLPLLLPLPFGHASRPPLRPAHPSSICLFLRGRRDECCVL